ncbi:hypothetical protein [Lentibacillus sediminis]|uniref:hypothetical protein n=1 Tax=Lentibacillus sediminis TaxID=1940529 RepID=UPI00130466D0|nr:hypothetical protein [Lentibacillus sediminis]
MKYNKWINDMNEILTYRRSLLAADQFDNKMKTPKKICKNTKFVMAGGDPV